MTRYPISTNWATGTTREPPDETVREQWHLFLLEEFDFACAKKKQGKLNAEMHRGKCRARTDEYMERQTRRVRMEAESDLQKL